MTELIKTASELFDENEFAVSETDPVERLRYFCSMSMPGHDWLDVEPFFDAVTKERDELRAALAAPRELMTDADITWVYEEVSQQELRPQDKRIVFAVARGVETFHRIGIKNKS